MSGSALSSNPRGAPIFREAHSGQRVNSDVFFMAILGIHFRVPESQPRTIRVPDGALRASGGRRA